ncbi:ATP-dependent Clp protease proteolytic subunit [Bremerella sp. T1]|uniref:ATP-dependent Clp protease proteolytic subunit n=1 Tax=Bremerella sp. TYQ1 TaxID=3119568 RepID=UPI001CCC1BB2|nr:ATP-dependent Clp protease proteolytic subunit [Bremerella volcania]UBM35853.1 ATP-dependent Clp protease proteolytic subunit [Bremerella volcania]
MAKPAKPDTSPDSEHEEETGPSEIVISGEFGESCTEIYEKILEVPLEGECTLYFDSPGGSSYAAIGLVTLLRLRKINATGIVIGECSSAAIWPFAACKKRYVTPWSVMLFHPMRWQSDENIPVTEAAEWVRHYHHLNSEMDSMLASLFGTKQELIAEWTHPGRFVTGNELAATGLAELIELF